MDDIAAESLIVRVLTSLQDVPGVSAIVLGGSRASKTHTSTSDIDIGLYFTRGFDLALLRERVAQLDDQRRPDILTEIGGWGPWVIGGGWLTIDGHPVDLIYRDLGHVIDAVEQAVQGIVEVHYQWGHPFGFLTTIYAAEIAHCRIVADPTEAIMTLKQRLHPYPDALRASMIQVMSGEARFTVMVAQHGLPRRDVS